MFGGAGDDILFVGGNDIASTGAGSDIIAGGFWIEPGEEAIVTDFEQGEDAIAYNYDPAMSEPTVAFGENSDGDAEILIDDEVVLVLQNIDFTTLTNDDVVLLPIDRTMI